MKRKKRMYRVAIPASVCVSIPATNERAARRAAAKLASEDEGTNICLGSEDSDARVYIYRTFPASRITIEDCEGPVED